MTTPRTTADNLEGADRGPVVVRPTSARDAVDYDHGRVRRARVPLVPDAGDATVRSTRNRTGARHSFERPALEQRPYFAAGTSKSLGRGLSARSVSQMTETIHHRVPSKSA